MENILNLLFEAVLDIIDKSVSDSDVPELLKSFLFEVIFPLLRTYFVPVIEQV